MCAWIRISFNHFNSRLYSHIITGLIRFDDKIIFQRRTSNITSVGGYDWVQCSFLIALKHYFILSVIVLSNWLTIFISSLVKFLFPIFFIYCLHYFLFYNQQYVFTFFLYILQPRQNFLIWRIEILILLV